MNKKTIALTLSSLTVGVVAAVLAAPLLHTHTDAREELRPMWAHHYGSLPQMVADADAVVLATVEGTTPGRSVTFKDGRTPLPFTLVQLHVDELLSGWATDDIVLEQTGGPADGLFQTMQNDGGRYEVGQQVLLFLKAQTDTGLYYLAHPMGRFEVERGELMAALGDDPVAATLDGRSVKDAIDVIAAAR